MIKRILLIGIIVATLFGVYILVKKPVVHYLRVKQIERDLLNFLNKKDDEHISNEGKIFYNYIINIRNTKCNISTTVEYYLDVIDKILQSKVYGRDIQNIEFPKNDDIEFYLNNIILGWAGSLHEPEEFKIIQELINDKDIKNYNQDTFKIELSEKLEKVLEHKSNDINKDWYMDISKGKIIELPYNCYIEYENYGRTIDYDKTEEIYLNSEFIKCELEKTDASYIFNNNRGLTAKAVYKDKDGNINNMLFVVNFEDMGSYVMITPSLRVEYLEYGGSEYLYVNLKSHDVDREKAKFNRLVEKTNEVNRLIDIGYNEELIKRVENVFESELSYDEVWERINKLNDKFYEYRDVEGLDIETINKKLLEEWENN